MVKRLLEAGDEVRAVDCVAEFTCGIDVDFMTGIERALKYYAKGR
jgi:hypothetical protein